MSFQSYVYWSCDVCARDLRTQSFHLPPGWTRYYAGLVTKHKCEICQRKERKKEMGEE